MDESFELKAKGGMSGILQELKVLDTPAPVVAVLCDADQSVARRWEDIKRSCAKGGLPLGDIPLPAEGFLSDEPGQPAFACWIMPDNAAEGASEAYLMSQITEPDNASLLAQSERFVSGVEPRLFPQTRNATDKAALHAWLAIQEEPFRSVGFAIERRLLLRGLRPEDPFAAWLHRIVDLHLRRSARQ